MAAAATLNPGDAVKPDAVASAALIQGEVPKEWEKDKLYILECWATWCGPCIKAIPHVNELHNALNDEGLRVIGMNVWEDGKEKVEKFVKNKGEGMAYPVVYVGKGGAFETEWLNAAGIRGIPHAFVVKNGTLLFTTHPSRLTHEVVSDLLAGGEKEAAMVKSMREAVVKANKPKDPAQEKLQDFMNGTLGPLLQKKEYDQAAEIVKTFIKDNPALDETTKMRLTFSARIGGFIEKGDTEGAAKFIDELAAAYPESPMGKESGKMKESVNKRIEAMKEKKEPKAE
jgi:thiol-disulfide isomerase/thioredoxin